MGFGVDILPNSVVTVHCAYYMVVKGLLPYTLPDLLGNRALILLYNPRDRRGEHCSPALLTFQQQQYMNMVGHHCIFFQRDPGINVGDLQNCLFGDFAPRCQPRARLRASNARPYTRFPFCGRLPENFAAVFCADRDKIGTVLGIVVEFQAVRFAP